MYAHPVRTFRLVALLSFIVLTIGPFGCAERRPTQVLLPGVPDVTVEALETRYPLAAGQSVRVERLGSTTNVSYHFVQLAPGAGERLHLHTTHDLLAVVLRGAGTQWIAQQAKSVHPGDSVLIPANTPHRFVNTGDTSAAALIIFSPPYDGSDQVFLDAK